MVPHPIHRSAIVSGIIGDFEFMSESKTVYTQIIYDYRDIYTILCM